MFLAKARPEREFTVRRPRRDPFPASIAGMEVSDPSKKKT